MSQHNGWDCSPDHFMVVFERNPLSKYKYYFVECMHCKYISKRLPSRKKANEAKRLHNDTVRKFDFGFGATNRDLERGLRALARSGYPRDACMRALEAPWPHLIPGGKYDDELPGVRGIGPKSYEALIAWAKDGFPHGTRD